MIASNIFKVIITGSCIDSTKISSYFTTSIAICNLLISISTGISFTSSQHDFYLIAISQSNTVSTVIINVTISQEFVITASSYCHTAQFTLHISTLEIGIFITFVITQVLNVFDHTSIGPVLVYLTGDPDTGTQICCAAGIYFFTITIIKMFVI